MATNNKTVVPESDKRAAPDIFSTTVKAFMSHINYINIRVDPWRVGPSRY